MFYISVFLSAGIITLSIKFLKILYKKNPDKIGTISQK